MRVLLKYFIVIELFVIILIFIAAVIGPLFNLGYN